MGSNKTFQQKGDRGRMLGESDQFRKLRFDRLYAVQAADVADGLVAIAVRLFDGAALPGAILAATWHCSVKQQSEYP
jgi:hypothetical protein